MTQPTDTTKLMAFAVVAIALAAIVIPFALPPGTFILVRLLLLSACAWAILVALRRIGSRTIKMVTIGVVAVRLAMVSALAAWATTAMVIAGKEAGAEYAPLGRHNPDLVAIVISRHAAQDLLLCALEIPLLIVMCIVLIKFGRVQSTEQAPQV